MTGPHPLDPLTADEIRRVTALLLRERGVARPQWRIAAVELREPAKEVVRGHRPGDPVQRLARAVVWDTRDGLAYSAELSVSDDSLLDLRREPDPRALRGPPDRLVRRVAAGRPGRTRTRTRSPGSSSWST